MSAAPCGLCLQRGRPLFDTEPPQKLRLVDRPEADCTHGLDRSRQRLEVHVGGEVEMTRICEGVGVGVLADSLQGFAERGFGVAIVDHQRGALVVGDAPADLYRRGVGAPFENCACARRTQCRRQQVLEKRHRLRRDREGQLSRRINLDPPLVPAAIGLYRLIDRQGIEELICKDDRWTFRHVDKRACAR